MMEATTASKPFTIISAASTAACVVVVVVIYVIHVLYRWFHASSPRSSFTLKLRQLKKSGAEMMGGSESNNVFIDEYHLVADMIYPVLDCCVMRALDGKLPVLSKQEALHAKMHNQAKTERKEKQGETGSRWDWYVFLGRFFLLRAGDQIAWGCAGNAEATTGVWFYLPMVLWPTKGFMNDEGVYHALEELEHAALTTDYLRDRVYTLMPLICFPIMTIVYFVLFLLPPVVAILHQPRLLVNPKAYVDFVLYYFSYIPTFCLTIAVSIVYWVLPFRHSHAFHKDKQALYEQLIKRRGIEFDILEEVTYRTDGVVISPSSSSPAKTE